MKKLMIMIIPVILFSVACKDDKQDKQDKEQHDNPFFRTWETRYGTPPFDEIENEHFLPAFKEAIKQEEEDIAEITGNEDAPTFENTIEPFDRSGKMLTKVSRVFFNLKSALSDSTIQSIAKEVSPMLSEHSSNIMLDEKLFERIDAVYEKRKNAGLNDEQIRVVEKYHEDFIRNGASLNDEDKEKLRKLDKDLSLLSMEFGDNVLAETNKNFKLVVEDEDNLAGLPDNVIKSASKRAEELDMEGKWVFQLSRASMIPFLKFAENRDLREKLYKGYIMRGNHDDEFDNKDIIKKMVKKRAKRAELLGHENHADYVIEKNMAESPEAVDDFLMKLWNAALPVAKQEVKDMQNIIISEGKTFKLAPWDWWYYAEKVKKHKYDLDESELKPYLRLENVRDGMFWVAKNLYDINFNKLNDIHVYHPDVEVYEVTESDRSLIGLLYMDYYTRDSKRGGAWCTSFRKASYDEDGNRIHPLASVVTNFTKGTYEDPALLSWDQANTLFHEFGHALHGLFTDGHYKRTAGDVPRDFVELPSQIMENFAGEPEVLKRYAKNYATGTTITDELIDKIQESRHFNQGFETVEYLAAALLDLDYHTLPADDSVEDVLAFEAKSMNRIGLIDEIYPRYRSTYFQHIFSGGYSAGYYVYIWAGVLDADAFHAFKESGDIFNKELAAKFRRHCLAEVGNGPAMEQYIKFRGQEPSEEYLLERRGLK
ncbi:MAG: M3 family metallopeptidase [Bacteroidota bacterium]